MGCHLWGHPETDTTEATQQLAIPPGEAGFRVLKAKQNATEAVLTKATNAKLLGALRFRSLEPAEKTAAPGVWAEADLALPPRSSWSQATAFPSLSVWSHPWSAR